VVMEGGPKQQKKYKQLMLNRVKWSEDTYTDKDGSEHQNKAELVWEVGKGFLLLSLTFPHSLGSNKTEELW